MSKNIRKVANLTKNEEFVAKFEENMDEFTYYQKDLSKILEEAKEVKNRSEVIYSQLYSIFHRSFPDVVIRKLADDPNLKNLQETMQ